MTDPLAALLDDLANMGEITKIEVLLKSGADVNTRDHFGHTLLMTAAYTGQPDLVSFLLGYGADKELVDAKGKTACDYAREFEHDEVIKILCQGA